MVKRISQKISSLKKGDIIMISFDPIKGHEQGGYRPALIVSENAFQKMTGFVFCIPITTKKKSLNYEIELDSKKVFGVLLPHSIRSLDLTYREFKKVDHASQHIMNKVEIILSKIMGIN